MDSTETILKWEDDLQHIFDMAERANTLLLEVLDGHYFSCAPMDGALRAALKAAFIKIEVAKEATDDVITTIDRLLLQD